MMGTFMIVFQHMPKTAGTYVGQYIASAIGEDSVIQIVDNSTLLSTPKDAFSGKKVVFGHLSKKYLDFRLKDYHYVTCLRDPVDRVISSYFYWRHVVRTASWKMNTSRTEYLADQSLDAYEDLARCLSSTDLQGYDELRNLQTWMLGHADDDRRLDEDHVLELAKRHLDSADLLGVMENISDFLQRLVRIVGGDPSRALERKDINANTERPAVSAVPLWLRKEIEDRNQLDIELYEYTKSLIGRATVGEKKYYCSGSEKKTMDILDIGPVGTPTPLSDAIFECPDFKKVSGYMQKGFIDVFEAILSLQRDRQNKHVNIVHFRPFLGQELVALGRMMHGSLDVHAVDFRDDNAKNLFTEGTYTECIHNVKTYIPDCSAYFYKTEEESQNFMSTWPEDKYIDIAILSRPFSPEETCGEFRFIDKYLSRDGIVISNEFFNTQWPHGTQGVFEAMKIVNNIVPILITPNSLCFARRESASLFKTRLLHFGGVVAAQPSIFGYRVIALTMS